MREIQIRFKKKRVAANAPIDVALTDAKQVAELFRDMQREIKEKMVAISLDTKLKILAFEVVAIGSKNAIYTNVSECISTAVIMRAASLIMVHNHPSGNPEPSPEDKKFTFQLLAACQPLGISFHDHVIIGDEDFYSFANEGLMEQYRDDVLQQMNVSLEEIADKRSKQR